MTDGIGGPAETAPARRNSSSSLRRALAILRYVADGAERRPVSLPDLAAGTDLPKSTVVRLVAPLVDGGLLRHDERTGCYELGPYTAYLGGLYLERLDLREMARPVLERLSAESGETTHLVTPDIPEVVYIDKVESPQAVRMYSRVGNRMPIHSTGVGKALLAYQDETVISRVVESGLAASTPWTITEDGPLREELRSIRARGYAVDNQENEHGIRCVAAPVFGRSVQAERDGQTVRVQRREQDEQRGQGERNGPRGRLPGRAAIGAISVSGPDSRVTPERAPDLARLVTAAASEISRLLGSPEDSP